ncbi:uncharacterized protein LOC128393343 [Panonychus citri]|uniref:uncharacterized protein LOC128393343 n=1 Tax=Panonychus citri TaxID=50023 RepID=UPI0023073F91|nr:uncharacterized protein LOC128393343 [Panonychus citri]
MFQQNQVSLAINTLQYNTLRDIFKRPMRNNQGRIANPINIEVLSYSLTILDDGDRVFNHYLTFTVYRNYVNTNGHNRPLLTRRAIEEMVSLGFVWDYYYPVNYGPVNYGNDEKSNPINHLVTGIDNLQLGPFIKQESSVFTLNRAQKSLFKGLHLRKSSTCIDWSCLAVMFNLLEDKFDVYWSCHSVFSAYNEFFQKGHKNKEPSG